MSKAKAEGSSGTRRPMKPPLSPEAEENQMIALATNLAKQKLLDGTASSQLIVHYLKLADQKTQLEREKLRRENQLLEAKTDAIHSAKRDEELYAEVLDALKKYSGNGDPDDY